MLAIKDQVINTKYYQKHIIKDRSITDDRQMPKMPCYPVNYKAYHSALAQRQYLSMHNLVVNVIHQQKAVLNKLIADFIPYYTYKLVAVLENGNLKLYRTILMIILLFITDRI
ncbi:hypothetical protein AAG570_013316 [Ranatra chinensis]|uniref:Uncharacterized protein n=1 Tax=Ranatra chinensis TaxID=642074 RepID=A0ABD0YYT8_9HEMI